MFTLEPRNQANVQEEQLGKARRDGQILVLYKKSASRNSHVERRKNTVKHAQTEEYISSTVLWFPDVQNCRGIA